MPQPVKMQTGQATIALNRLSIRLPANAPASQQRVLRQLTADWQAQTGVRVAVTATGNVTVTVKAGADLPTPGERAGPDSREAYHLTVNSKGVAIRANSTAGLFHAVQTLRQLVRGTGRFARNHHRRLARHALPGLHVGLLARRAAQRGGHPAHGRPVGPL